MFYPPSWFPFTTIYIHNTGTCLHIDWQFVKVYRSQPMSPGIVIRWGICNRFIPVLSNPDTISSPALPPICSGWQMAVQDTFYATTRQMLVDVLLWRVNWIFEYPYATHNTTANKGSSMCGWKVSCVAAGIPQNTQCGGQKQGLRKSRREIPRCVVTLRKSVEIVDYTIRGVHPRRVFSLDSGSAWNVVCQGAADGIG